MSKVDARKRLEEYGLHVPPERLVSYQDVDLINDWVATYSVNWSWYLRLPNRLRGAVPRLVVSSSQLQETLEDYFSRYGINSILVSGFIPASMSGVLVTVNDMSYIEHVDGALEGLLTKGGSPNSVLISKEGKIEAEVRRETHVWYEWNDKGVARRREGGRGSRLPEVLRRSLVDVAEIVEAGSALEWLYTSQKGLYFVDHKSVPNDLFPDMPRFLKLIEEKQTIIARDWQVDISSKSNLTRLQDTALVELDDQTEVVIAKCGGILSHLCLRAATEGIPCAVSEVLYNELPSQEDKVSRLSEYLLSH